MAALETVSVDNNRSPSFSHNPGSFSHKMITIGQLLKETAQKWPNKDAIISNHEKRKLTLQQLNDEAEQLGAGLLQLGLKPGDRLALLGSNSLHWCTSFLGAAKAGLITVLLNPVLSAPELELTLNHVGARGIISDRNFLTTDLPSTLAEVTPSMSSAPHGQPLSCSQLPDLSFFIVATEEKLAGCYRLQDVFSLATDRHEILKLAKEIQPENPAIIMFTSGSTGIPKAAVLSHFSLINNVYSTVLGMKKDAEPVTVCVHSSLFHISGITSGILGTVAFGNTVVLAGPFYRKEFIIEVLQNYRCTFMAGIPTTFIDLYHEMKRVLPKSSKIQKSCEHMKAVLCSGDFVTSEVVQYVNEMFPRAIFLVAYGITELCGAITLAVIKDTSDIDAHPLGRLNAHVEVKIVDDNGKIVPFGTPGEAWFRSKSNFLEYWKDEEWTNELKTKQNWFKSRDIMVLRENGHLTFIERMKHIIVREAQKIRPIEVENLLRQHPDVTKVAVYGVTDKRTGQEVAASVSLRPSSTVTEEDLREYCKGKVIYYKIPRFIRFIDEFPMTSTGKVMKYNLRMEHEQELKEIHM